MTTPQRLTLVRAVHTAIYVVMVAAIVIVLFAGVTGARGPWLWAAAGLLLIESVVFAASGLKCPLTAVVARYSDGVAMSDTFFPERFTRHTFAIFAPLMLLGFGLLAVRWLLS